jgi:hypothetical protein
VARPPPEARPLTTAALALGIVGAITGALALGWEIASYLLSGVRVKVRTKGTWAIAYGPGQHEDVVIVEARIIGRQPVAITSVGLLSADGTGIADARPHPLSPRLPMTYQVGAPPLNYIWPVAELRAFMAGQGRDRLVVCGTVGLGTGRGCQRSRVGDRAPRCGRTAGDARRATTATLVGTMATPVATCGHELRGGEATRHRIIGSTVRRKRH